MIKILFLGLVLLTCTSWSATEEYNFKYQQGGEMLEYKREAASYKDALMTAAQECIKVYKKKALLSEDEMLDLVDLCANPR